MTKKNLPGISLGWIQKHQISLDNLPSNCLSSVRENAAFLESLCGLNAWELGRLLFPQSTSKGSQQTQTVKLLNRGSLEELVRVPEVLGFKPSLVFRRNLRDQIVAHVKSLAEPMWEESVFADLPTCGKCGTVNTAVNARFCSSCGKKL